MNQELKDYKGMLLIRRTEELILNLFSEGKVNGTTHTYIGQEANAVGIIAELNPETDYVISNHRCHGHFLAIGGPLVGLLGEIMGKSNGICGGRGGSQHLKFGKFFSNGVLGGGIPIGCGLALSNKMKGVDGIVTICIGDGALGEGVLYESLNMAALWNLPVLFLVENNKYAQTTPTALAVSGSIRDRAAPFGIKTGEIDSTDVAELRKWGAVAIDYVRSQNKPFWGVIKTYRLAAHSKGDDTRTEEELNENRKHDPLTVLENRITESEKEDIEQEIAKLLTLALEEVEQAPAAVSLDAGVR